MSGKASFVPWIRSRLSVPTLDSYRVMKRASKAFRFGLSNAVAKAVSAAVYLVALVSALVGLITIHGPSK